MCMRKTGLNPQIQNRKKQKDTQTFTLMQTFLGSSPKFDASFVFLTHEFELENNLTPTITCTLVPAERHLHSQGEANQLSTAASTPALPLLLAVRGHMAGNGRANTAYNLAMTPN